MEKKEILWSLNAKELQNCPVYRVNDSVEVQLPTISGNQYHHCSMPIATFLPLALKEEQELKDVGDFKSGFKKCACRWSYCKAEKSRLYNVEINEQLFFQSTTSLPFAERISPTLLETLGSLGTVTALLKGHQFLQEENHTDQFFLLQQGRARLSAKGKEGKFMALQVLGKGDCFGQLAMLTGRLNHYLIEAIDDCQLLQISRKEFFRALGHHPELGLVLYQLLADRMRNLNQKLSNMVSSELSGDLTSFSFIDLAQIVHNAKMSGHVEMEDGITTAFFSFRKGDIIFARSSKLKGLDAVIDALKWTQGHFRFRHSSDSLNINIEGDTMGILLEAIRQIDETSSFSMAG